MSEERNTGGPAFPMPAHKKEFGPGMQPLYCNAESGMTLLDYFAAKAMQGFLSSGKCTPEYIREYLANDSWIAAAEMLKARAEA